MAKYNTNFIPQNKAPKYNDYIHVYKDGGLIGKVKANNIKMPTTGNKLYSFGALADVHVTHDHDNAMAKFEKAMTYFNNVERVAFTGIAGDLISSGTAEQFTKWREVLSKHQNIEATTGNHDVEDAAIAPFLTRESTIPYTGYELYYSFEQGEDLFIMFGMSGWVGKTGETFTADSLQWLYETLEANRNRRVFIFEHCPSMVVENSKVIEKKTGSNNLFDVSSSGAVIGWAAPTGNLLNQGTTGGVFRSLMAHYKNIIWIHGHSHMEFQYQADCSHLNYDRKFGCHSIHIPSSAEGRELKADGSGYNFTTAESSGYVIDVYENYIVLRGRDFVTDKFVPIATYCIDTTLQTIEAGTFIDSTGTIMT